ncbi:transposable element Tc1 transposase [Trichonephila clavipes]|nr:transposable element Tc1 transposase [Trichonephila clavipes]
MSYHWTERGRLGRSENRLSCVEAMRPLEGSQPEVMVWGVIYVDSQTFLVVIRSTLTAERYVDDISRTVLLPFLLQYPGLIFQQDNARSHSTCVAMNCLRDCQTLPWPGRSPDLSN